MQKSSLLRLLLDRSDRQDAIRNNFVCGDAHVSVKASSQRSATDELDLIMLTARQFGCRPFAVSEGQPYKRLGLIRHATCRFASTKLLPLKLIRPYAPPAARFFHLEAFINWLWHTFNSAKSYGVEALFSDARQSLPKALNGLFRLLGLRPFTTSKQRER